VRGFRSRKFVQAAAAELALLAALAVCLLDAGVRPHLPYIVGGLVAVAVGYGAANAWQARGRDDGAPPGM